MPGGRDRGWIEVSAGKQRDLKRRGPGKGRSSKATSRESTPRGNPHLNAITQESIYSNIQGLTGKRGGGNGSMEIDGDRWVIDTDTGRDCARHVAI